MTGCAGQSEPNVLLRKGDREQAPWTDWGELTTGLDITLECYLSSSDVKTFQNLRELMISGRLKQVMPSDTCSYVIQNETGDWVRSKAIGKLTEKFAESKLNAHPQYEKVAKKSDPEGYSSPMRKSEERTRGRLHPGG